MRRAHRFPLPPAIQRITEVLARRGGQTYLVGGAVRDLLLGREVKDLDLEVHGLPGAELLEGLRSIGPVLEVGRSFSVCKLKLQGCLVDVALPRSADAAREPEPHLGTFLASERRDLTVNALLYDPSAEQIIDHHGGLEDLEGRVLREVSAETFVLDPLRALRAVRFAGSLGEAGDPFRLSESLQQLCRSLSLTEEPDARIREELDKGLLESPLPGVTFDWMRKLGLLQDRHPSIWSWTGPEHGAWLNRIAASRAVSFERSLLTLSALFVPLSRPSAQDWLEKLGYKNYRGRALVHRLLALLDGSRPLEEPRSQWLRRQADQVSLPLLHELLTARSGHSPGWREEAERLGVWEGPLPRLLEGGELRRLGYAAGPTMGSLLRQLRSAQHQGRVHSREEALAILPELLEQLSHPDNVGP